jgi:hypothetical protein
MMALDRRCPLILTRRGVLRPPECRALIRRINRGGPELAPINTPFGPRIRTETRNNERVLFEDSALAAPLFSRVAGQAPKSVHGMELVGANELIRCYRYKAGMRFAPHADGAFVPSEREQSWYTLLVYLNQGFIGGHTTFLVEPEVSIPPETGTRL